MRQDLTMGFKFWSSLSSVVLETKTVCIPIGLAKFRDYSFVLIRKFCNPSLQPCLNFSQTITVLMYSVNKILDWSVIIAVE